MNKGKTTIIWYASNLFCLLLNTVGLTLKVEAEKNKSPCERQGLEFIALMKNGLVLLFGQFYLFI